MLEQGQLVVLWADNMKAGFIQSLQAEETWRQGKGCMTLSDLHSVHQSYTHKTRCLSTLTHVSLLPTGPSVPPGEVALGLGKGA